MRKVMIMMLLLGGITSEILSSNGGYSGSFLRVGLGARGISMGNAQVATAGYGFGFYYNPAALPYLEQISANLSYSFLSLDRRHNYLGISLPIKPQAGFSIGWIYSGVGDLKGYDSRGVETEKINHGLHAIYFSFGIYIIPERLSVGLSAKYLLEDISDPDFNYDGRGFGADLGILYQVSPSLSIGYQLKDINGKLKSNTNNIFERGIEKENKFPLSNRIGFFYLTPVDWIKTAYDFEWSTAGENKHHLGFEFAKHGVAGRIGYDTDHLTFGGGVEIEKFFGIKATLDYAFVSSVIDEGVSHIFTWQFGF
jgi:hypothetical protein